MPICQTNEFLGIDSLGEKALAKGIVGEVFGLKVVKVPTSYMPDGVYFIAAHKGAVILPYKIRDAKVHSDAPGISGALLEGRSNFDAFVIGARCMGVYAAHDSKKAVSAPEISVSGNTVTITGEGEIYYTTDNSDPRYSASKEKYASSFEKLAGDKVRAVCVKGGCYSAVSEK